MKKILLKILLGIEVLAVIIYGILSYIVVRYDSVTGITTDGFGRTMVEPPWFLKIYLHIGEWAGLGWFIIDTVGFFIAIAIGCLLYNKIKDKK